MSDRSEENLVRISSSRRAQLSTPSTAHPGESLAPAAASLTSPADNSGDLAREHLGKEPLRTLPTTLPMSTSPTDNIRDNRLQSAHYRLHVPEFLDVPIVPDHYRLHGPGFLYRPLVQEKQAHLLADTHPPTTTVRRVSRQRTVIQSPGRGSAWPRTANNPQSHTEVPEPTMNTPGVNLDALANLQADELKKLTESLKGLAASSKEGTPTPETPQRPPIPATGAGEEEVIGWEQVVTGHVPLPERPPTRPPPPHNPIN